MHIEEGDVFITKLERNFYGAFKVIKRGKSFFDDNSELLMIAVLNYIDRERPKIDDPRLKEVLCCNRFYYSNWFCVEFFTADGKYNGLQEYEYLGNLPLTSFENALEFKLGDGRKGIKEGFPLSGVMTPDFGNNAFLEWRWTNEREEFIEEVERDQIEANKRREEFRKKQMKPKKMMDDNAFWEVIDKIDWNQKEAENQIKPAIDFLSQKKVTEIKQFKENLTYKLYLLDTREHAKNIGEYSYKDDETHFSADYFLYARCCVIANGKDFFEKVLSKPDQMPKDIDFEELLYLADEAYEKRTKKELEYDTGCSYETYSNYKGWE